ncbi:hypothetical protein TREMEDRAFT_61791 [Tremella mesenterica DSM 1558]|uniref:uncharacterized protein n=1 Tax=Tremella mesenterica (strain ATCC 24925 / CBS 8224 / DSM 1558 / NBRC 9311 / NRRL Y-6157 / RJB 2259-6 / UBC 559-6) TaxID=578456 RepID=UPI0003F48D98|nr:uncharacterized protein TREMEDRAFT_61791 [Tremella mesenterica DSM 1558]EIW70028.1 hypothetical protein TREMEDRAFT_61791 [Tremella mesenterica DSM 1558]
MQSSMKDGTPTAQEDLEEEVNKISARRLGGITQFWKRKDEQNSPSSTQQTLMVSKSPEELARELDDTPESFESAKSVPSGGLERLHLSMNHYDSESEKGEIEHQDTPHPTTPTEIPSQPAEPAVVNENVGPMLAEPTPLVSDSTASMVEDVAATTPTTDNMASLSRPVIASSAANDSLPPQQGNNQSSSLVVRLVVPPQASENSLKEPENQQQDGFEAQSGSDEPGRGQVLLVSEDVMEDTETIRREREASSPLRKVEFEEHGPSSAGLDDTEQRDEDFEPERKRRKRGDAQREREQAVAESDNVTIHEGTKRCWRCQSLDLNCMVVPGKKKCIHCSQECSLAPTTQSNFERTLLQQVYSGLEGSLGLIETDKVEKSARVQATESLTQSLEHLATVGVRGGCLVDEKTVKEYLISMILIGMSNTYIKASCFGRESLTTISPNNALFGEILGHFYIISMIFIEILDCQLTSPPPADPAET